MIFGEYNEALDRQAAEDYAKEQREIGEKEGIRKGIEQGVKQGIQQGVKQGIQQGVKQGVKQGIQQGIKQKAIEIAGNLLKEAPEWSDQEIAEVVKDITAEEVAELRKGE